MAKKKLKGIPPGIKLKRGMVLAAGLGKRMRPITLNTPKPLIEVAGRNLLDRALDRMEEVAMEEAVVNIHYLGDRIERHLTKNRDNPKITISDETDELLETGGGVKKALPHFKNEPFLVMNSDAMTLNGPEMALDRLAEQWDPKKMDALLLVSFTVDAYGYEGRGDFSIDPAGKVTRRSEGQVAPYLFTGTQILKPDVFEDTPDGPFSLNLIYDRLIEQERLYAVVHDGEWFHVGTPDGLDQAEAFMSQRYAGVQRR